ncbi:MAG: Mur ligase family protein, partial [Angustibacter sp.]
MIPMQLKHIAELVGGELIGAEDPLITGPVVSDARLAEPGGLFVARPGAVADGVTFVPQAVARGARAVLARRATALPTVVVADVDEAFARLAGAVHERLTGLSTIAITGSSGKTSTKDCLAEVLRQLAPELETIATEKSYNGEVGVPLTVLRAGPSTRYLVAEMGARGIGHIAHLTRIAPPSIAVVLNVGSAHLAEFGSVERTAEAKSELVTGLSESAVAVLNADDPRV